MIERDWVIIDGHRLKKHAIHAYWIEDGTLFICFYNSEVNFYIDNVGASGLKVLDEVFKVEVS